MQLNAAFADGARAIHNVVHADQDKNYFTTVKMLSVMLDKGLVRRDDSLRPQTFTAAVSRRKTQKSLVSKLVQKAFDGSASSLVMQAFQTVCQRKKTCRKFAN